MSGKLLVFFVLAVGGLLVFPGDCLAWGPGVHLYLGNVILANLNLLSASIANFLNAYPVAYLYGCLSADFLIGKGKQLTPTHCHSWEAGFRLLEQARTPELKSYALGYLSHLAADVAAHNFYVPNMIQVNRGRGKISHTYIEMLADREVDCSFEQLKWILDCGLQEADRSLIAILERSRLNFSIKKALFKRSVYLSGLQAYGFHLKFVGQKLFFNGCVEYMEDMLTLSRRLVEDVLNREDDSIVISKDPMGYVNLALVKEKKRFGLRKKSRQGLTFFTPSMQLARL